MKNTPSFFFIGLFFLFLHFVSIGYTPYLQAQLKDSHWREAQSLFQRRDYTKVMHLLEKHMDQLSFVQKKLLLKTYGKLNKANQQLHLLNSLMKSHSNNTYILTSLGNVLLSLGGEKNKLKAIEHFKKALKINPRYFFAYHGLIRIFEKDLEKRNDHRYELKEIYKSMIKERPQPEYYRKLCYLSWMDFFWKDTKKYCAKGKRLEPHIPENHIYFALALIHEDETSKSSLNSSQKGLDLLKQSTIQFPKSELAWVTYGTQLQKASHHLLAKNVFYKATRTHPHSLPSWVGLSKSYLSLKKHNESIQSVLKACRIHTKKGQIAIKNLIYTLSQEKRISKEETDIKQWISKFYQAIDTCLNLRYIKTPKKINKH